MPVSDVLLLLGLVAVLVGLYLIYAPLPFIAGGLVLIRAAIARTDTEEDEK
jgi:hypothetical protein